MRPHGPCHLCPFPRSHGARPRRRDVTANIDKPEPSTSTGAAIDRAWLYVDDARIAEPLTINCMTNATYTYGRLASPTPGLFALQRFRQQHRPTKGP